jgi:hypothetical protein
MRYFLKKNNEPIFLEIDQAQYIDWTIKLLDANIYSAIEIKWIIAGNKQTQYVDQVLVPGAFEQNLMTLQQAELVMPGISAYITDPLQLYTDTEFLVPKDINA